MGMFKTIAGATLLAIPFSMMWACIYMTEDWIHGPLGIAIILLAGVSHGVGAFLMHEGEDNGI